MKILYKLVVMVQLAVSITITNILQKMCTKDYNGRYGTSLHKYFLNKSF